MTVSVFPKIRCFWLRAWLVIVLITDCFFLSTVEARTPRIVGGTSITGEQQQVVSLQYTSGNGIYHFCGASVIAPRWLLTAAHCINANGIDANRDGLLDQAIAAFVGQSDLALSHQAKHRVDVAAIVIHPAFDAYTLANDIALLYLAEPLTTAPMLIGSEAISTLAEAGSQYRVLGWGATDEAGELFPTLLQQIELEHATCQYNDVPQHVFCAGGIRLQDACFGDSGGPAYVLQQGQWLQYGIVSFGAAGSCGVARAPTAFTFVPHFSPWITHQQGRLHFGLTPVFQELSQRQTLRLYNTSEGNINISRVSLSSSAALTWYDDCSGATLGPHESCPLQILLDGQTELVNEVSLEAITEAGEVALKHFAIALDADNQVADIDRAAGQNGGGGVAWFTLLLAGIVLAFRTKLD